MQLKNHFWPISLPSGPAARIFYYMDFWEKNPLWILALCLNATAGNPHYARSIFRKIPWDALILKTFPLHYDRIRQAELYNWQTCYYKIRTSFVSDAQQWLVRAIVGNDIDGIRQKLQHEHGTVDDFFTPMRPVYLESGFVMHGITPLKIALRCQRRDILNAFQTVWDDLLKNTPRGLILTYGHSLRAIVFLGQCQRIEGYRRAFMSLSGDGNIFDECALLASEYGHVDCVKELQLWKKDVVLHVDAFYNNALHHAVREGHEAVVRYLLSTTTLDINAQNKQGETVLHLAVQNGRMSMLRWLMDHFHTSLQLHLKNKQGNTAYDLARTHGYAPAIQILESAMLKKEPAFR